MESVRRSWWGISVSAATAVVSWTICQPAMGADVSAASNLTQLQRQLVDDLVAGKDVARLVEQLKLAAPSNPASSVPSRNTTAAELERQINDLHRALRAAAGANRLSGETLDSLSATYEAVQASHLLYKQEFASVSTRLSQASAAAIFEQRRAEAEQGYDKALGALTAALAVPLGTWLQASDGAALLGDDAFQGRAREGIRAALAYLDQQPKAASHPILRASVLPFRQLKLGVRAPALTPTIVPSYANPSDAATAPTMPDLSASIDAPLTDEILAKAKSLDYDYMRIYEFVRDEIRTEWYAGGAKGAVGTLRQKSGNDVDQASLLIALFRASGLPARYIHGAIDLPVEEVIGSLGLRDATQATAALTRARASRLRR